MKNAFIAGGAVHGLVQTETSLTRKRYSYFADTAARAGSLIAGHLTLNSPPPSNLVKAP